MSEETVRPARRPFASATTTDTPDGQRRKSARCSTPISSTRRAYSAGTLRLMVCRLALRIMQRQDLLIHLCLGVFAVRRGRVTLPHDVGDDSRALDRRAVHRAGARRMRTVRIDAVAERAGAGVREEAVLALP